MSYSRDKNKKFRRKTNDYMDDTTYHSSKSPEKEENVNSLLSAKALRSLPKSSYAIQADPYAASLPTSDPYPIINAFNKKVGGHYSGIDNLDGGNVQQYPNSLRSSMLKAFDYFKLNLSLNYRYRPMKLNALPTSVGPDNPYIGSGLIDECRQAISEAASVLQSTTFTQMSIYKYVIETDLPMGQAIRVKKNFKGPGESQASDHYLYDNISDVIYATSTFYQLFLQEILNVVNYHNAFRLKMGTMIRTSWNRETPTLNNLFGLFKKKSFLSIIDSLCLTFPGEYIDTDWAKQVNMITAMLSRRSNAFLDPVLEIQGRHVRPSVFRMYMTDAEGAVIPEPIFDMDRDLTKQVVIAGETVNETAWQAVDYIKEYLSAYQIVTWARNHVSFQDADAAYFNKVNARFSVLSLCMTSFKTLFNDVREVLDVISRTGLNTWVKGFRPSVIKDTDAPLFDNVLVDDIYKTVFSGATKVTLNNDTKRLRTFSLWNMYEGIPEYDAKAGGCFLTLSGKTIDVGSNNDYFERYIPIMCYYDSSILGSTDTGVRIQAVARDGKTAYIKAEEFVMSQETHLNRLVPLPSQAADKIRVPKAYASSGVTLDISHWSYLDKAINQIFGCSVTAIDGVDHVNLDPDIVATYSVELEDITNEAIAYARATGPFKGSTGYEGKLGFSTFGQS